MKRLRFIIISAVLIIIAVPVFHGWYILWSLPLAVLLGPDSQEWRATLVFSLMAMLIIPYYETMRIWWPVLLSKPILGHAIGVGLMMIPTLIAFLVPKRQLEATPPA